MKKVLALLFALLASAASAQVIPSGPWGSLNYWGVGGASQVLNPGTAGQCLTTQGVGSAPVWVNCQVSSLSLLPSINTNQFYGNVSGQFAPPVGVDVNTILNTVGYDIARPPAVESILYKSNVGPNFNWQTLPPGTTGSVLTSGGPTNPPFWTTPTQAALVSICSTVGAVLYFDTPSLQWKCLSPGTAGQLLQTGGAAGNPSWLTVTLATLGGVPSTRNVNTSTPLGGGGSLSSDLTLTCPTCATTTNGGALSATSPAMISAAGVIACATCATTTNGGALSATSPDTISAAGVIACPTCATTTNGGALSATSPVTISAAGVIACATCTTGGTLLTGTVLAKTAAYGPVTGDCGDTITLGGSSIYDLTLSAASGYAANCGFLFTNLASETRAKRIVPNGLTAFFLYPGQSIIISNQSNTWNVGPISGRWRTATAAFFFRPDGSDSGATNDGLANSAAGSFQTANACMQTLASNVDIIGGSVGCQQTCGSPPCSITTAGQLLSLVGVNFVGQAAPYFKGDCATPTNVKLNPSTAVNADIQITFGTGSLPISICGFELAGGSNVNHALYCSGAGSCNLTGPMQIDAIASTPTSGWPAGCGITSNSHASVYLNATLFLTAGVGAWTCIADGGYIENGGAITINTSNTPAWTGGGAFFQWGGVGSLQGVIFNGTGATGNRCLVQFGGVLHTQGGLASLPGSTACSVAAGTVANTGGNYGMVD